MNLKSVVELERAFWVSYFLGRWAQKQPSITINKAVCMFNWSQKACSRLPINHTLNNISSVTYHRALHTMVETILFYLSSALHLLCNMCSWETLNALVNASNVIYVSGHFFSADHRKLIPDTYQKTAEHLLAWVFERAHWWGTPLPSHSWLLVFLSPSEGPESSWTRCYWWTLLPVLLSLAKKKKRCFRKRNNVSLQQLKIHQ